MSSPRDPQNLWAGTDLQHNLSTSATNNTTIGQVNDCLHLMEIYIGTSSGRRKLLLEHYKKNVD
jgi:hypothetical protein